MKTERHPDLLGERGNITALWAFSESGLGGFLHAFKTPFNGLALAGMSVFCIGLLAGVAHIRSILRSLGLVLGIKAAVSPHSPPTAYIAVAFQGLIGSLLLGLLGRRIWVYILFGGIALLESAIQRILVLTLLFGEQLWVAVNGLTLELLKFLGFNADKPVYYLLGGYCLLYTLWGMYIGYKTPATSEALAEYYWRYGRFLKPGTEHDKKHQKAKRLPLWLKAIMIAALASLLLIYTPAVSDGTFRAGLLLAQTIVMLLLWYFVLVPILQIVTKKIAERFKAKNSEKLNWLMDEHLKLRQMITPAWRKAGEERTGMARLRLALAIYCAWALYDKKQQNPANNSV